MSYFDFFHKINKPNIIFELGSRDLVDAIRMMNHFDCTIYSFECNPDCLQECNKNLSLLEDKKKQIILVEKAVSMTDGLVTFYPFDLQKYDNMGASSMLQIDFSTRNTNDPDYNRPNPQKEIHVDGTRLDTFMDANQIEKIDLLCIDLQGYELNAIKSLGNHIKNVKYIITECSIQSTYKGGSTFQELNAYLNDYHFQYVSSNRFGDDYPDLSLKGFSEFDALFVNSTM